MSSNHQIQAPSGDSVPSVVPCSRAVTCRVLPLPRSQANNSNVPVLLLTYNARSGASSAQSGRETRAARKRSSQAAGVVVVVDTAAA